MTSARLRSLRDLMLEYNSGSILAAINKMTATEQAMNLHQQLQGDFRVGVDDFQYLSEQIDIILREAQRMKLKLAANSAKKLQEIIKKAKSGVLQMPNGQHPYWALDWINTRHFIHYSQQCRDRFSEQLDDTFCFVLAGADHDFYQSNSPLFGDAVNRAFGSAAEDIREAGRCRAVGRWTACVMHLMRALEPALLAFQNVVEVKVPKKNWQDILNQIDAKIRENGHQHVDHAWNSEASLQFLRFKDAWRNYAMHGRDFYSEERAVEIYDSVRAFMRHLSTRLSE